MFSTLYVKVRSSAFRLNCLCRSVLLAELIYRVRVHIRWIPTDVMPADIFTREATLKLVRERQEGRAREGVCDSMAAVSEATSVGA